jgi:hypothetical protein
LLYNKHFALRGVLPLAGALAAVALAAPAAGAATFGDGSVTLNPSRAFTKQVRFTPTAPATRSGRGVEFPIDSGTATMSQSNTGSFTLDGGFRMRAGRRSVSATRCTEVLAASVARLRCRFAGKTIAMFEQNTRGGKISPDSEFTQLTGTGIRVRLSRAGANFLNRRLRLSRRASASRVRPRQAVGTASVDATRTLTVTGGEMTIVLDPQNAQKLRNCGINVEPIAPARQNAPSAGQPAGSLVFSAVSGNFPATTLGGVRHSGGARLSRPDNPSTPQNEGFTSDLTDLDNNLNGSPPNIEVFSSDANQRVVVGTVEGGGVTKTLTDTGGQLRLTGNVVLGDLAVALLGSRGCTYAPGESRTLGTVDATADVT